MIDDGAGYAKLGTMFRIFTAFTLFFLIAGCLSFGFRTERKSQFTDVNNNLVFVEYGTEQRTETLANGAELNFNRKVRITLPDGERAVLYQTISAAGVRYHTPDNKFIFIERGPWCKVIKEGATVYQGVFRNNCVID